jgi:hypothetical protein
MDDSVTNRGGESKDTKFVGSDSAFAPGRLGRAVKLDGKGFINAGDVAAFRLLRQVFLRRVDFSDGRTGRGDLVAHGRGAAGEGYSFQLIGGRLQVHLTKRWLDDALRVETQATLEPNRWHHVMMTYDGSRLASGVSIYADGKAAKLKCRSMN